MSEYLCIVSFGIVVPVRDFCKVYGNCFDIESKIVNHSNMELMALDHHIGIFYDRHIFPENVFICSRKFIKEDVRDGNYAVIGQAELSSVTEYYDLEAFVSEYFEGYNVRLMMFTCH